MKKLLLLFSISPLFISCNGQEKTDLSKLNINQAARDFLSINKDAFALYDFARTKNESGTLLPELEKLIIDKPSELDYDTIIKSIFY